jgi:hypothetical protein
VDDGIEGISKDIGDVVCEKRIEDGNVRTLGNDGGT